MKDILKKNITNSISYKEYYELVKQCVIDKKTTGIEKTQERINFTKLNFSRMRRLDKTIKLSDEEVKSFKNLPVQTWLVISESWCGDAAQTLPILNKIAEPTDNIKLRIVLRDKNIDLMNTFLTNGAQAIPKVIILDKDINVINTWGARSTEATKLVVDYKNKFGKIDAEFKKNLQLWYNKDKGISIINDFLRITSTNQ